jgi:hypothetical protein
MDYDDARAMYRTEGKAAGLVWFEGENYSSLAAQMLFHLDDVWTSVLDHSGLGHLFGTPPKAQEKLSAEFFAAAKKEAVADESVADQNAKSWAVRALHKIAHDLPEESADWNAALAEIEAADVATRADAEAYFEYRQHSDLNERVKARAAETRARARTTIRSDVQALTNRLATEPDHLLSRPDAELLAEELGRLIAPIQGPGPSTGTTPVSVNKFIALIKQVVADRADSWREFDESAAEWRTLDPANIAGIAIWRTLNSSGHEYRREFGNPQPLPSDSVEAEREADRRVAERKNHADTAMRMGLELLQPWTDALGVRLKARLAEQEAARAAAGTAAHPPMPAAQAFGVSPRGAELWCQQALLSLGVHDAIVTRQSSDGGEDIYSTALKLSVSVKNYAGAVDVIACREIYGVAASHQRRAVLMTSGRLTRDAEAFCVRAPVAVIHYDVETARLRGLNGHGQALIDHGPEGRHQLG